MKRIYLVLPLTIIILAGCGTKAAVNNQIPTSTNENTNPSATDTQVIPSSPVVAPIVTSTPATASKQTNIPLVKSITPVAKVQTVTASISNFVFIPSSLNIKVGTSVTWTNNDSVSHTVTADNNSWDSGLIAPGASFSHTFNTVGTVTYHCAIHRSMQAQVVISQ